MSDIPENLKYAETHEWISIQTPQLLNIGITDFAQQELGDLVYIELPTIGRQLSTNEQCAVVESVKTASELFSPASGIVTAVNQAVIDEPALVNDAPYDNWLFSLQIETTSDLEQLMDAAAYMHHIDE